MLQKNMRMDIFWGKEGYHTISGHGGATELGGTFMRSKLRRYVFFMCLTGFMWGRGSIVHYGVTLLSPTIYLVVTKHGNGQLSHL